VGLPELVTSNLTEYAAMATWLAEDAGLLGEIRKRLAENRLATPLFDTDLSRRHIESAYQQMWRIHQSGGKPESFNVEHSNVEPSADREMAATVV
jgi:protein O-GlcNAc transferase